MMLPKSVGVFPGVARGRRFNPTEGYTAGTKVWQGSCIEFY